MLKYECGKAGIILEDEHDNMFRNFLEQSHFELSS